jgi:hypothetical protein
MLTKESAEFLQVSKEELDQKIKDLDTSILGAIRHQEEIYKEAVSDLLRQKENALKDIILKIEEKGKDGEMQREHIRRL